MQNPIRYFDEPKPKFGKAMLAFLIGLALAMIALSSFIVKAHAWSGCGAGAHASHMVGELNGGGPIGLSSTGHLAGVSVNCDWRMQQIVIGGEAAYSFMFGDLESLGIQRDLTLTGRLGVLITPAALLYGHAGWTQLDTSGPNINGVKLGFGTELKLPDAPLYIDTRYSYAIYDVDSIIGPGVDARGHAISVALKFKFGEKYQPANILAPEPAPKPAASAPAAKKK